MQEGAEAFLRTQAAVGWSRLARGLAPSGVGWGGPLTKPLPTGVCPSAQHAAVLRMLAWLQLNE